MTGSAAVVSGIAPLPLPLPVGVAVVGAVDGSGVIVGVLVATVVVSSGGAHAVQVDSYAVCVLSTSSTHALQPTSQSHVV